MSTLDSPPELYELFLALAPMRIHAARSALGVADEHARCSALDAALIPFAVDAVLLGADGLAELGRAIAASGALRDGSVASALDTLEASAQALGSGDASGARVHESALKDLAARLRRSAALDPAAAASAEAIAMEPAAGLPSSAPALDEHVWAPDLAEDMVAAFLDECSERVDGLAERLLLLEQRHDDQELIAALFRDLHTLKGSSAFAGLTPMNRVAHAAEDLVAELRSGQRVADRPVIDALLAALDILRAILDRAQRHVPVDVDKTHVLAALKNPAAALRIEAAGGPVEPAPASSLAAQQRPHAPGGAVAPTGPGTLRIDFEKVDLLLNLVGELVLARGRLSAAAERHALIPHELGQLRRLITRALDPRGVAFGHPLLEDLERTERVIGESYGDLDGGLTSLGLALGQMRDQVMKLRMIPIARLFTKYQRTVRELSHKLSKEVKVELEGADTELDKVLVEQLDDPLLHLVRNAVDHGIERPREREAAGKPRAGTLRLIARQRGGSIIVAICDDGAGMDAGKLKARAVERGLVTESEAAAMTEREAFDLIFRPGFSTAASVSDVSGRGVGMDVVREAITRLKGTVVVESQRGFGSTVELRLPLTLAITQILAARVGTEAIAVPLDAVVSAQAVAPEDIERVAGTSTLRVGERLVPVIDLAALLGLEQTAALAQHAAAYVVVVDVAGELFGLLVQQLLGRHEVVIKSLGAMLAAAPFVAGATLVDDRVLLVMDLVAITQAAASGTAPAVGATPPSPGGTAARGKKILIAEDSPVVQQAIRRAFEARGFDVRVAGDGAQALELAKAERFDAVSTDVVMPHVDGLELTRALRADPRHERVPIVMLTSRQTRIDELRGLDAGADAYLTKPVDAAELVRQVEFLLARRAAPAAG